MNCSPPRRLNVLVMYPEPIVRAGLVETLRRNANFDIRVHDGDAPAPAALPFDVVIADYDGALRLATSEPATTGSPFARPRILTLTASGREADIRRAVDAGIHGYLLLDGSLDELVEGVKALGAGARYLCAAASRRVADSLSAATLTLREQGVLEHVALGHTNKTIAAELGVEMSTVKAHVRAIMSKLGAISRTHATGIAVARGLVDEHMPSRGERRKLVTMNY